MPSCVCCVTMEILESGEKVFLVRFYESVQSIAMNNTPIDTYECHEIITDTDTATYVSGVSFDEAEWEEADAQQV
jgi:hypothetical protein